MKEVEFKDRVPSQPGKIRLIPVEGQRDIFIMERADEPIVEGTPLNKSTFNSIVQSRLTGRYYAPSVDKNKFGEVSSTTNPIPSSGWLNETSTGATNGKYEVLTSGSNGTNSYPTKAFDGSTSSGWTSNVQTGEKELFFAVKFPEPVTIYKMKLQLVSTTARDYTISGSNDGMSWTVLGTVRAAADGYSIERTLSTTGEYLYYKVSSTGEQYTIRAFELSQYTVSTLENAYIVADGVPEIWDNGQRVTVEIPILADDMGVVRNTLNGVAVNVILQPSKRYELIYNGTSFDAKEV